MAKSLKRQVLERAIEIISDENHWCHHRLFSNEIDGFEFNNEFNGKSLKEQIKSSTRSCAIGAIYRALNELGLPLDESGGLNKNTAFILEEIGLNFLNRKNRNPNVVGGVAYVNDRYGHKVIIKELKKTLEEM